MIFRTAIGAGAFICLLGAAAADETAAPLLDHAKSFLGEGRTVEAADMLDKALLAVWERMPLSLRTVEFVESVESYGVYRPRENNFYQPNDEIRVYVEPVGFKHLRDGDFYGIQFTGDFELKVKVRAPNSNGVTSEQIILGKEGFAKFSFQSRRPNREFYMLVTYKFEGLKPGDYSLVTTLHDAGSGKSASFSKTVRIVAPPPGGPAKTDP